MVQIWLRDEKGFATFALKFVVVNLLVILNIMKGKYSTNA